MSNKNDGDYEEEEEEGDDIDFVEKKGKERSMINITER